MNTAHQIAREMTGYETLPPDLKARIDRVAELTEKSGGGLVSRQVIANIIFMWELQL